MKKEIPKALMGGDSGSLTDALNTLIDNKLRQINTAAIGVIEKFDPETQMASIRPAIKKIVQTEKEDIVELETVEQALLVNVPVMFPGGGDWFLTFPVKKGDECILISSERSIGDWKKNGGIQDPSQYKRMLSNKDSIAIVGINSKASSLPSFNSDFPEFRNRDGDTALRMTDDGVEVDGDLTVDGDIEATGDIKTTNGDITAGTISLKNHIHTTTATVGTGPVGVISVPS